MFNLKKCLLTCSVLLAATTTFAQEAGTIEANAERESSSPERFFRRIIAVGSLTNAGYEGGDSSRYEKPNGYNVGILLDLLGMNKLVLETGALYRQLGTTMENGLGENHLTANYISVPATAKYYFSGQERNSLYLKAGAMGSTLVSNNTAYVTSSTTKIGARTWETALIGGLGAKLVLNETTDLVLEGSYTRALDSVFEDVEVYRSDYSGTLGVAVNL
ncbi:MAG: outer membrane beta-barrel protein [Bdellovibrionales bacterium]